MNETPRSNRLHIAIFGRRNAGKSSLINALTNQDIALVSNVAGTTTDPVYKAMEILPIGPVVIIDTAGIDDEGALGELRVKKSIDVLNKTDLAVLVINANDGVRDFDKDILEKIKDKKIPVIAAVNKIDETCIDKEQIKEIENTLNIECVGVSAKNRYGIDDLKNLIIKHAPNTQEEKKIVGDLIEPNDFVVLVTPIDKAAPKGRLILPQQQTIRDVIDHGAVAIVTRETELKSTLDNLGKKPKLVITDSQAFELVDKIVPKDIPMTSFSILFARYKADLEELVIGVKAINTLKENDHVLICEGCTHHRQEGDIGKDKIPKWIEKIANAKLNFEWTSGVSYPNQEEMKKYKLIVHCGGCMLNAKEMQYRISKARENKTPIVNYGVLIGHVTNVLDRALDPFPVAKQLYKG
ncbi:[FeFe] hydrogenase H-cluster maturation GTPase HydF [Alkalithermobacter thermoalcaliphilus JW-YL-7 = DSM 7308]|uniref:(FeFe)-hydrogenase H-cluster maturation GTPase HydF n=1 Tax=Alkalithermobacter thermoalcaliphilus JW-YL-7 = DSM 7308 TaxID=1121328 RepID=A0A150FS84_CLOPD|nr:(FeFe)-hydrogenase H-cluster maturation GTPase HydF [[Clostridium] paradoxum JW-YL-7 = DSM 7308]SHL15960.1 [FeFe] hydrogenase H-cluster maturation GTPase HydF [[Clostridium] paradoxum JW-YL-7 = DSM 7308]